MGYSKNIPIAQLIPYLNVEATSVANLLPIHVRVATKVAPTYQIETHR